MKKNNNKNIDCVEDIIDNIKDEDIFVIYVKNNIYRNLNEPFIVEYDNDKFTVTVYKLLPKTKSIESFAYTIVGPSNRDKLFDELERLTFIDVNNSIKLNISERKSYFLNDPALNELSTSDHENINIGDNLEIIYRVSYGHGQAYKGLLTKKKYITVKNLKRQAKIMINVPITPFAKGENIGYVNKKYKYNDYFEKNILNEEVKKDREEQLAKKMAKRQAYLESINIAVIFTEKSSRTCTISGSTSEYKGYPFQDFTLIEIAKAIADPKYMKIDEIPNNDYYLYVRETYINLELLLKNFKLIDSGSNNNEKYLSLNKEVYGSDFGVYISEEEIDKLCEKAKAYNDPDDINTWRLAISNKE